MFCNENKENISEKLPEIIQKWRLIISTASAKDYYPEISHPWIKMIIYTSITHIEDFLLTAYTSILKLTKDEILKTSPIKNLISLGVSFDHLVNLFKFLPFCDQYCQPKIAKRKKKPRQKKRVVFSATIVEDVHQQNVFENRLNQLRNLEEISEISETSEFSTDFLENLELHFTNLPQNRVENEESLLDSLIENETTTPNKNNTLNEEVNQYSFNNDEKKENDDENNENSDSSIWGTSFSSFLGFDSFSTSTKQENSSRFNNEEEELQSTESEIEYKKKQLQDLENEIQMRTLQLRQIENNIVTQQNATF